MSSPSKPVDRKREIAEFINSVLESFREAMVENGPDRVAPPTERMVFRFGFTVFRLLNEVHPALSLASKAWIWLPTILANA
jgi:hypothetical protein